MPPDSEARSGAQPPPLPPDPDGPVLAELEKLQRPRNNWIQTLVIFGVSLALFLAVGRFQWNWRLALMLVPILFLHELGHYIAMRCFRYQNLRMFFIPFFGAAVSGLKLQVPGWKKAVVALAGPLPGIVIGAVLAFAAWHKGDEQLSEPARLFLYVNGLNLLPLLPLDGGRVFDALFYVRSRTAETIALILAGVGMLALSIAFSTQVLMFVGIAMFLGMPHLLRVSRVAERLRENGFVPDPEDAATISDRAARAILPEVREAMPLSAPRSAKVLAQVVMNVYERLHTPPPGLTASVALLLSHGAAVVTVIVFLFAPTSDNSKATSKRSSSTPVETPLAYDCAHRPVFEGNSAPFASNLVILVASSPNAFEIREAFDAVFAMQTHAALTWCGQTLFIAATNVDRRWEREVLRKLSGETTSTLLERKYGDWRLLLSHVRATAPDEETALRVATELEGYFKSRRAPPWVVTEGNSSEELHASGVVERKGRALVIRDLQFHRLDRGLPAMLQFLCAQEFTSLRYGMDPKSH